MKNPKNMTTEELIELADEIKKGMLEKFMKEIDTELKSKVTIPANIDPIKLADEIKGDISTEWLKRREYIKSKPLLVH